MSRSRMIAVVTLSERIRAVTHRSMSMPSACSCFCAPQPPWAIFGGGLVQRRLLPASKQEGSGDIGCRCNWASARLHHKVMCRFQTALMVAKSDGFNLPSRLLGIIHRVFGGIVLEELPVRRGAPLGIFRVLQHDNDFGVALFRQPVSDVFG